VYAWGVWQAAPEAAARHSQPARVQGRAAAEGFSPTSPRAHWIGPEQGRSSPQGSVMSMDFLSARIFCAAPGFAQKRIPTGRTDHQYESEGTQIGARRCIIWTKGKNRQHL